MASVGAIGRHSAYGLPLIVVNRIVVGVQNWASVVKEIVSVEALPRRRHIDRLELARRGEREEVGKWVFPSWEL